MRGNEPMKHDEGAGGKANGLRIDEHSIADF
jgi:hypothetical protein